jgi:hypothetical protein
MNFHKLRILPSKERYPYEEGRGVIRARYRQKGTLMKKEETT